MVKKMVPETSVIFNQLKLLEAQKYMVAYLLHARNVEPQKQPLLSNTRTQQQNNRVVQSVSRQRLGKHISALCNAVTSSTIWTVFCGVCAECL
jgi:short subunit fatty acids transporter